MKTRKYPDASTEPLGIIEANECPSQPHSLVTKRFQACFNEIERLRAALLKIQENAADNATANLAHRALEGEHV